jgi:hypothetical protein
VSLVDWQGWWWHAWQPPSVYSARVMGPGPGPAPAPARSCCMVWPALCVVSSLSPKKVPCQDSSEVNEHEHTRHLWCQCRHFDFVRVSCPQSLFESWPKKVGKR